MSVADRNGSSTSSSDANPSRYRATAAIEADCQLQTPCPQRKLLITYWTSYSSILAAACLGLGLLFPLILFAGKHLTIVGMTEESTGYRYFYSLRLLYASRSDASDVFVPQGQLVGIADMALQLLLTTAGHPPAELTPRIDIFAYAAAALPHLLTVLAFIWAVRPLRSTGPKFALVALLLIGSYDHRAFGGYLLTLPDYLSWAEPVCLLTLGTIFRLLGHSATKPSLRAMLLAAIFGGVCLSIKASYAVFAAVDVALLVLYATNLTKRLITLAIALIVTPAVFFAILLTYYRWQFAEVIGFFKQAHLYVEGSVTPQTPPAWIAASLSETSGTLATVGLIMPAVFILSILLLPNRRLSLVLLLGSLLSNFAAYQRSYPYTQLEVNAYTAIALLAWIYLVLGSVSVVKHLLAHAWCLWLLVAALGLTTAWEMTQFWQGFTPAFSAADEAGQRLNAFLRATPGRTLFLIPSNDYRPMTLDSAIEKGGSNPARDSWSSEYVRSLFPNRDYALGNGPFDLQINWAEYDKVVFVSLPGLGGETAAISKLEDLFGLPADHLDCSTSANVLAPAVIGPGAPFHSPNWELRPSTIHGCRLIDAQAIALDRPPTPRGLRVSQTGPGQAVVNWDLTRRAPYIIVERRDGPAGEFHEVGVVSTGATSHFNPGLTPGYEYSWRLMSCNSSGCSPYTPSVSALIHDTSLTPPTAPEGVAVSLTGSRQALLTWRRVNHADVVRVERKDGPAATFQEIGAVDPGATTHLSTGLTPANAYWWRIRACNPHGCSPYSSEVMAVAR